MSSETDRSAIDELRAREVEAAQAGDVASLLELRVEDFVAMPPGRPAVRGIAEVRKFLEGMFEAMVLEETVIPEEVVVVEDQARERGTFTGTVTNRATGEKTPLDGKYLWIARRLPGGAWKYAVQMWNDNRPAGGA